MATIVFGIENVEGDGVAQITVYTTAEGKVTIEFDASECEMTPLLARQLARVIEACAEAGEA